MLKHIALVALCTLGFAGGYAAVLGVEAHANSALNRGEDRRPLPVLVSEARPLKDEVLPAPKAITLKEVVVTGTVAKKTVVRKAPRSMMAVRDLGEIEEVRCGWRDLQQGYGSVKVCDSAR